MAKRAPVPHPAKWFKLSACAAKLESLGVSAEVAEAAAHAAGADDAIAGDLIFSGIHQALWVAKEVDLSAETARARMLMAPPLSASIMDLECAILDALGDLDAAEQELWNEAIHQHEHQASSGLPGPAAPAHGLQCSAPEATAAASTSPQAPSPHDSFDAAQWEPVWEAQPGGRESSGSTPHLGPVAHVLLPPELTPGPTVHAAVAPPAAAAGPAALAHASAAAEAPAQEEFEELLDMLMT